MIESNIGDAIRPNHSLMKNPTRIRVSVDLHTQSAVLRAEPRRHFALGRNHSSRIFNRWHWRTAASARMIQSR